MNGKSIKKISKKTARGGRLEMKTPQRIKRISLAIMAGLLMVGTMVSVPSYATVPGTNSLVNYNSTNTGPSTLGDLVAHISEDGNTVVWSTSSHDVIPSDPYSTSTASVLYERNMQTGATSYVTVDMSGVPVHVDDVYFAVSRTGRYVAFSTSNTNMVASPTVPSSPVQYHIYIKDTLLGVTTLVDKTSSGVLANIGSGTAGPRAYSVSDDGRFVVFSSQATNLLSSGNPSVPNSNNYFYVKDMQTGQVINPAVSNSGTRANSYAGPVYASCDGSLLTFQSNATNLTPQDNGKYNTYLVDLRNGFSITNLTYNANQDTGPLSISCNGRYILIGTTATNLTTDSVSGAMSHWFRLDRLTNTYSLIDKSTSGYISTTKYASSNTWGNMSLVSDNGLVVFSSDDHNMVSPAASNNYEVYLRNPEAGTTELVAINSSGTEQNPAMTSSLHVIEINAKGDSIMYSSIATNLVSGFTTGAAKIVLSKVQ